jgi:excisionase family DNA binding protein
LIAINKQGDGKLNNRITLDAKEAAKYIGISYWSILELTKRKKIPFSQVGGRKLFRRESLDKWLEDLEEKSICNDSEDTQDISYGKLRKIY